MENNNDKTSSEKENKKVQTDKQFKDNEVHEGKADNSIHDEDNNKTAYPYKSQPEFIDRDSDSKDKS